MAISLKRYEPQVGVSAQTGTQAITGGLASSMIQQAGLADKIAADTFQMFGEAGVEIYKDFQKRNDEAEVARINKEFMIDSAAFQSQIEQISNEEDIQQLSLDFMSMQQQKMDAFKLSPQSREAVNKTFESNLAKQSVLVGSRILKVGLQNQDRTYLDIENDAINGVLREGFDSLEEQFDYANKQRVDIGTKTYDSYLSEKRSFGQNRYFAEMTNLIKNDINTFEETYDATKLNQAQQEEINRLRGQAENEFQLGELKLQTNTDRELRSRYDQGLLTVEEIDLARTQTESINGRQVNVITSEQANVLEALVTGRATGEESTDLYVDITKNINKLNPEEFRMDSVDKILKKLYTVSSTGAIKPVFSAPTTRKILKRIDQIITKEDQLTLDKDGWQGGKTTLTSDQQEVFSQISSVFDSMLTLGKKGKDIGLGVQRMDALQDSFFNDVVIDKKISASEWAEQNIPKVKQEIANAKAGETLAPQVSLMDQDQYPTITTQEQYDALESGQIYIENNVKYRKP